MHPGPIDPRLITVGVALLVIIFIVVALYVQRRRQRTAALRQRFGSEYERTSASTGR
jgi:protein-S-isoprenylcysteine O-methyltransferase Ste14